MAPEFMTYDAPPDDEPRSTIHESPMTSSAAVEMMMMHGKAEMVATFEHASGRPLTPRVFTSRALGSAYEFLGRVTSAATSLAARRGVTRRLARILEASARPELGHGLDDEMLSYFLLYFCPDQSMVADMSGGRPVPALDLMDVAAGVLTSLEYALRLAPGQDAGTYFDVPSQLLSRLGQINTSVRRTHVVQTSPKNSREER